MSSKAAVAEVTARPWPEGTQVEIVSVVDTHSMWNVPGLSDALRRTAEGAVAYAEERVKASGLACSSAVLSGDPKSAVVDHAAQTGADLVVVGSHDVSDAMRFLLGSVARAVVLHAPCSVEIVRPRPANGAMKVLLATDGSECSQRAAQSIALRPWPKGTEVRVLSVVELSSAWFTGTVPAYLDADAVEALRSKTMQHARDAVASAEKAIADAGLPVSGSVAIPSGAAKQIIITQAAEWGADLIVMGSHGLREASRFLLGSVSEPVALHAGCSVEIVRAAAGPDRA